jgi:hypothetical protein
MKVERVSVVTEQGETIRHTAAGKIPRSAIAPSSMYQQYGNFFGVGVKITDANICGERECGHRHLL